MDKPQQPPLYQAIATAIDAHANCVKSGNREWEQRWSERLDAYDECLPSGAGFDSGSKIRREEWAFNNAEVLINTSYHHMDEHGGYDGWTHHVVTIRANLAHGFDVDIDGDDRNDIKDYMAEVFDQVLSDPAPEVEP